MSPTESAPPETAIHHVRNLLMAFEQPWEERAAGLVLDPADVVAIVARLRAIQRELEQHSTLQHGANVDCPEVRAGIWAYCHGHPMSDLRAVGDHVERVYPEAASAADESDA